MPPTIDVGIASPKCSVSGDGAIEPTIQNVDCHGIAIRHRFAKRPFRTAISEKERAAFECRQPSDERSRVLAIEKACASGLSFSFMDFSDRCFG